MLTVTAGLFSCNTSTTSDTQGESAQVAKDAGIHVIVVSPTTGQVTAEMTGDELKKYLADWKATTAANFKKKTQYYDENSATVYWVKHRNTKAMFSYFPDKWIGIAYHAYGFKGVKVGNMVYTPCEKDSVGEICFADSNVTTNVTETDGWISSVHDEYTSLTKGIAEACAMQENDAVFKKEVLPKILSDMKKLNIKTDGQMTSSQIAFVLQNYTEKKKPAGSTGSGKG